ncbi:MAG TPA: molybdopterin-dependent oxidoreductase [Thermoanaerobaculia bacterium]
MASDDRLPPGQAETRKFPLVGETSSAPEALDLARWSLILEGRVANPRSLTYAELLALPQRERLVDIHCVTGWTRLGMRFTGLPLASLLAAVGASPSPEARFVRFVAYSERKHDTSLPLDLALADTWLVHGADGQPLSPEHGYPLRTLTPSRYFYKSLKWVHRIEFLAEDQPGYWERESFYHNNADPWPGNERYVSGSVSPEKLESFRNAASYVPYRGPRKLLLTVDLRGWAPGAADLGDLHIKDSDLRGARLDGADLRGANLTRSRFDGASLVGADLRGADLEGASFIGADMTNADLRDTALSATRFFERDPEGRIRGAKIDGLLWEGAAGLLEDQEDYLRGIICWERSPDR